MDKKIIAETMENELIQMGIKLPKSTMAVDYSSPESEEYLIAETEAGNL